MKTLLIPIAILFTGLFMPPRAMAGICDPDSLPVVTLTGTINIEVLGSTELYFLITDTIVYRLNFGPWWYIPSEGNATLPNEGDTITVLGGLNLATPGLVPGVIIVYEIDGEFWRNPYDPLWNKFNNLYSTKPSKPEGGVACGWPDSTIVKEAFTGVVLVDTTLLDDHYFLDADYDGIPDYRLNFGPPWYLPAGDIALPDIGDTVNIDGAIVHTNVYPVIIVFNIDGDIWRDATGFGPSDFGKWMHGGQNNPITVVSPFDTLSHLRFQHGWHGNGMPNSMYCQLLELHHQNLYEHEEYKAVAGFELAFLNQERHNMMNDSQYRHGMRINNNVKLQLHYNDIQLDRARVRLNERLHLYFWDPDAESWVEEFNITVDTSAQVVTVTSKTLFPFYMITSEETPASTFEDLARYFDVCLYPNPAMNESVIEFDLPLTAMTNVSILNGQGQNVVTVLNAYLPDGKQRVTVNTRDLASGIYYVVIDSESYRYSTPLLVVH